MKKLVFLDIDGTLLPVGDESVPKEVEEIIKNLDSNIKPIICTGRCYHQAKKYLDQLGMDSYICSNGQEVCYEGEIIYSSSYDKTDKEKMIKLFEEKNMNWGYETREKIYLPATDNAEKLKGLLVAYGLIDIEISDDYMNKDIYQMWAFGEGNTVKEFLKNIDQKFKSYQWTEQAAEILPSIESKGNGIKNLIKFLGEEVETYGFGDGINDLEMFEIVDYSVAMGNSEEEIKAVAKHITTDCRENGIKNGFAMVGLIKE